MGRTTKTISQRKAARKLREVKIAELYRLMIVFLEDYPNLAQIHLLRQACNYGGLHHIRDAVPWQVSVSECVDSLFDRLLHQGRPKRGEISVANYYLQCLVDASKILDPDLHTDVEHLCIHIDEVLRSSGSKVGKGTTRKLGPRTQTKRAKVAGEPGNWWSLPPNRVSLVSISTGTGFVVGAYLCWRWHYPFGAWALLFVAVPLMTFGGMNLFVTTKQAKPLRAKSIVEPEPVPILPKAGAKRKTKASQKEETPQDGTLDQSVGEPAQVLGENTQSQSEQRLPTILEFPQPLVPSIYHAVLVRHVRRQTRAKKGRVHPGLVRVALPTMNRSQVKIASSSFQRGFAWGGVKEQGKKVELDSFPTRTSGNNSLDLTAVAEDPLRIPSWPNELLPITVLPENGARDQGNGDPHTRGDVIFVDELNRADIAPEDALSSVTDALVGDKRPTNEDEGDVLEDEAPRNDNLDNITATMVDQPLSEDAQREVDASADEHLEPEMASSVLVYHRVPVLTPMEQHIHRALLAYFPHHFIVPKLAIRDILPLEAFSQQLTSDESFVYEQYQVAFAVLNQDYQLDLGVAIIGDDRQPLHLTKVNIFEKSETMLLAIQPPPEATIDSYVQQIHRQLDH